MKIVIISDSHDNIVRLRHVIGFGEANGAGAIIHCGDWNTPLAVKQFNRVKIPVFGVLGNADIDPEMKVKMLASRRSGQEAKIKCGEEFLAIKLDNRKIGVAHYPPSSPTPGGEALKSALESGEYDLLLYGHTHCKGIWKYDSTLLANPGALHKTDKPSFAVYDTKSGQVEFVDIAL